MKHPKPVVFIGDVHGGEDINAQDESGNDDDDDDELTGRFAMFVAVKTELLNLEKPRGLKLPYLIWLCHKII